MKADAWCGRSEPRSSEDPMVKYIRVVCENTVLWGDFTPA